MLYNELRGCLRHWVYVSHFYRLTSNQTLVNVCEIAEENTLVHLNSDILYRLAPFNSGLDWHLSIQAFCKDPCFPIWLRSSPWWLRSSPCRSTKQQNLDWTIQKVISLSLLVWASSFNPIGRTRSRGRCWAAIRLFRYPEWGNEPHLYSTPTLFPHLGETRASLHAKPW